MISRLAVLSIVAICLTTPLAAADARQEGPSPAASEIMRLGLRGVYFVENQGQWGDESVHYGLKSRGLDVAFRESSLTMHLSRPIEDATDARRDRGFAPPRIASLDDHDPPFAEIRGVEDSAPAYEHLTLTVAFPGSNAVTPRGAKEQTAKFNYFVGGDGRGIASNVPSFGAVIYENLYDGVDLHVTGNDDGVMKYEFHCAPGADHAQIRIRYEGIDSLCIDDAGNLQINTSFGTLADGAPVVWQEDGGTAVPAVRVLVDASPQINGRDARSTNSAIPARFELCDARTYRIALDGPVDPTRELIIDPEVEWMTYLGGSGFDSGYGIAVDSAGNALVTGETNSTNFEGRNNAFYGGPQDAFVVKVNSSGTLQWMTYFGARGYDRGDGIAVDSAGNALVMGYTNSTGFQGRNNAYHGGVNDAFVVKVSASGALQWMTYLGGSRGEEGYGIAVDRAGNALVTGVTSSTDFEGRNNANHGGPWDAFVVKVSASGILQWMTYLGGSLYDYGLGIAVDSAGNALVTGFTQSTDFEGRNNAYHGDPWDAFVIKLSASGLLQWMTYLGGSLYDLGNGIAVDSAGNALVTGYTHSNDFEGRNNAHYGGTLDAFVVKVSASGVLQWMTYLGGSDRDHGYGIAVDSAGNALVTGDTYSPDFEGRNNAFHGVYWDAFVVKVSASGALQWMTYLGGSGHDHGYGIAVDSAGNALVTGITISTDFKGRNNARHAYNYDTFVVKLRGASSGRLQLLVAATCPSGGPIRIEWSGASPGGQVALLFARNTGSFIIPNNRPCAGTTLGLGSNQIQLAWQGGAGANGSRTLNTTAGPGACGGYLQLLDLTPCATSNVARIE